MLLTNAHRSTGAILANNAKGTRRARFTVAHELGHFLMERHQLSGESGFTCSAQDMHEARKGKQHVKQKTQANQFAIELLAPAYLMTPFCSDDPDLRDAQRLRDFLDLSLKACVRRMLSLRDETLAVVWPFESRVRYSVRSKNFPFVALKKGDRVPQTSAAFRAITKAQPGFTQLAEADPHPWTGRSDLELCEQTRVASRGHAVTLLWAELPADDEDGGLKELGISGFR
ncbi:ImmA/IrrE family metallo-endopeptidase [Roseobacter ponti]|uniref:ImmA/IrrE family metallo-endopeptidase n=1 Tax=Roseobacter ponti TaxID=1891787 RepID=A0A858SPM4_9RHOB|nr:ImmA/IrrE family metallo-endopeptidase [Roseobacter ponti]QJF50724.1 ImmA/IrrE family metallo-endopeptidase [Roseobacter ponti]